MDSFVFISYSRKDEDACAYLVGELKKRGIDCRVDKHIGPGDKWLREVHEYIKNSVAIILLVSEHSMNDSQWVYYEVGYIRGFNDALHANGQDNLEKRIIPLYRKNVPADTKTIPMLTESNIITQHNRDWCEKLVAKINELKNDAAISDRLRNALQRLKGSDREMQVALNDIKYMETLEIPEILLPYLEDQTYRSGHVEIAQIIRDKSNSTYTKLAPRIIQILEKTTWEMVATNLIEALANTGNQAAVSYLEEILSSEKNIHWKKAAISALSKLQSISSVDLVAKTIDCDFNLAINGVLDLIQIKHPSVVHPTLNLFLKHKLERWYNELLNPLVDYPAEVLSFVQLHLSEILTSTEISSDARWAIYMLLVTINNEQARDLLFQILKDEKHEMLHRTIDNWLQKSGS